MSAAVHLECSLPLLQYNHEYNLFHWLCFQQSWVWWIPHRATGSYWIYLPPSDNDIYRNTLMINARIPVAVFCPFQSQIANLIWWLLLYMDMVPVVIPCIDGESSGSRIVWLLELWNRCLIINKVMVTKFHKCQSKASYKFKYLFLFQKIYKPSLS